MTNRRVRSGKVLLVRIVKNGLVRLWKVRLGYGGPGGGAPRFRTLPIRGSGGGAPGLGHCL